MQRHDAALFILQMLVSHARLSYADVDAHMLQRIDNISNVWEVRLGRNLVLSCTQISWNFCVAVEVPPVAAQLSFATLACCQIDELIWQAQLR
jgi:hypothetical protein